MKKEDGAEAAATKPVKAKGKKAAAKDEGIEEDEPEPKPKKARGKKASASKENEDDDEPPKPKKARAKKVVAKKNEDVEDDSEAEPEIVKPAPQKRYTPRARVLLPANTLQEQEEEGRCR